MFALSVSMRFPAEIFEEVSAYVKQLAVLSRLDAGCVEYWWATSMEAENELRLYEVWESQELLGAHLQLPHEKEWMEKYQGRATDVVVATYDPTTKGTMGG